MTHHPTRRLRRSSRPYAGGLAFLLLLLLVACGPDPVAPSGDAPLLARAASDLAVTSAMPNVSLRATTLDVHVFGTNFEPGAVVTWLLKGVGDPTRVRTNYTTYVSPTELVANITISPYATTGRWDVQVALSSTRKPKKGIGTEMFTIK